MEILKNSFGVSVQGRSVEFYRLAVCVKRRLEIERIR
jgi:hypothetical protein